MDKQTQQNTCLNYQIILCKMLRSISIIIIFIVEIATVFINIFTTPLVINVDFFIVVDFNSFAIYVI